MVDNIHDIMLQERAPFEVVAMWVGVMFYYDILPNVGVQNADASLYM